MSVRRTLPVLACLALLGVLLPPSALAHVRSGAPALELAPTSLVASTAMLRAAPPITQPFAVALGFLASALLALAMRRRPRYVLVLAVVVLVAVFTVEAGIHSVHHVGDRTAAACPVAVAASHLTLCLDAGPPVVTVWLTPAGAVADEAFASPAAAGPGTDLARAPPAPIA